MGTSGPMFSGDEWNPLNGLCGLAQDLHGMDR
jgi:hypothetical protein